jgi:hypothetical protein
MADAVETSTPTSAPAPAAAASAAPASSSGSASPVGGAGADSVAPANTTSAPANTGTPSAPNKPVEAPRFPGADEYKWDEWDGKPDALPELIRPWHEKFHGRYQKDISERDKTIGHYKSLYDALSFNEEDPRVGELTGKVQTYEQKVAEYESRIAQYEQAEDARIEADVKSSIEKFKAENPDFWSDKALGDKLSSFLDEGWHFEHAAKVAKMPADLQEWAQAQRQAGVPEQKIVEYAEERAKMRRPAAPAPRPGVSLVNGSGPVTAPVVEPKTDPEQFDSFEDWRNAQVKRSLARSRAQ